MKRILIYALEEDIQAQEKLNALHADSFQAGRRNAELWEGFTEPARSVFIFPNKNADAIAAAYTAQGVTVEVINEGKKGIKENVGGNGESLKADEGQNDQAKENGPKRRVR